MAEKAKTINGSGIQKALTDEKRFGKAGAIDDKSPDNPGIYCVRIINSKTLPNPFHNRKHIYIGIASKSLKKRLNQELRGKGHGTFFRSIGAVLGFRPERGSLREKKNKSNYKFNREDQEKIIEWINDNLELSWVPVRGELKDIEKQAIQQIGPLFNLQHNPQALEELKKLRAECRRIANIVDR